MIAFHYIVRSIIGEQKLMHTLLSGYSAIAPQRAVHTGAGLEENSTFCLHYGALYRQVGALEV